MSPAGRSQPVPQLERRRLLYVIIDRPEDASPVAHSPNIQGFAAAAQAFDRELEVVAVTIAELEALDAGSLDARYRPLAVLGGGSFTEWFMYGVDSQWRRRLDHYMGLIRTSQIPMLAVCGSHQLVAAAFNGFQALAHMSADSRPVRISEELALPRPRGLWPQPRVGEQGTYPLRAARALLQDPVFRVAPVEPWAASHHSDMVVDASGFQLLYGADLTRSPATRASPFHGARCAIQAMRLEHPSRLLYTSQFHPEMSRFSESSRSDEGFGRAWIGAFLAGARRWWMDRQFGGPVQ